MGTKQDKLAKLEIQGAKEFIMDSLTRVLEGEEVVVA